MNAQHDSMHAAAAPPGPPSSSAPPPPASGAGEQTPATAAPPATSWTDARPELAQRRKSPPLACLLSIMPGLGQVYVGYYRLGFIHIVVVGAVISILGSTDFMPLSPMLGIFLAFFVLYNIVDAGRRATLYNQALAGMEGVAIPQEITLPTKGGSLFGGVVLIVVGAILLSNTVFGISLVWLEDWWPLAPMALGVYLVVREMLDRARQEE